MAAESKSARRQAMLAARRALSPEVRRTEADQLCAHLDAAVRDARTVCAYVPVGTEPGSPALLDRLRRVCHEVLLPVARTGPGGEHLALQWGRYVPGAGDLTTGRFGVPEPPEPWLPAQAVARAQVVLVPALAVARTGVRLGRGGGFYDRSLPLCAPGTRLVAVVRDDEVLDALPAEPHDVRMTHALTPGSGLITLAGRPTST